MNDSLGLRYRRVDLHVHTPASECFENRAGTTADDIVKKALEEKLEAIAITDHNTATWVDRIKEAAKNKLVVFPGVEISTTAGETTIHIIAIFDKDKSSKDIEGLLGELKIAPDKYGKPEAYTTYSPSQVIDKIAARKALAIGAHANSAQGICGGMKGNPRSGVLENPNLAAVETTFSDFANEEKRKSATRVIDLLDGNHGYRKLAVYQTSDNLEEKTGKHQLDKIGAHYSLFKLDEISLEGLRQCFCDPDVRIRLETEFTEVKLPRIKDLTISQGFLGNQHVCFHGGLNSIVGGKGTGKSLIVEFLRFALNQASEDKDTSIDHNKKLEKRLEFSGTVTVNFELPNKTNYSATRTYDGNTNPITCVNSENQGPYEGDLATLFPILPYSQNEVIKISEDEAAQLRLIDSFVDISSFKQGTDDLASQLRTKDKELADSIQAAYHVASLNTQLSTVAEKLKNIDKSLQNQLFEEMKAFERKKSLMDQYNAFYKDTLKVLDDASRMFHNLIQTESDEQQAENGEQVEVTDHFQDIPSKPVIPDELKNDDDIRKADESATQFVLAAINAILEAKKSLSQENNKLQSVIQAWMHQFEAKKSQYDEIIVKAGGDQKKLETERQKLQLEQQGLQEEMAKYSRQMENLENIRQTRKTLLDKLDTAHKNHYNARKAVFDNLTAQSGGRLKLEISYATNAQTFKSALWNLRSSSGIHRTDTDKVVEHLMPRDFLDLLLSKDAKSLAAKTGLAELNAAKLLEVLNSKEDLTDVLSLSYLAYPEDTPSIQFKKEDGEYYPISEVSTGQKCTALLIIALSEGTRPVLIDQPEDSLDTTSVYEDIVTKLRGGKDKRQFILTTHNASVGVAADSDNFIVLKSTAVQGEVNCYGAIDRGNVKSEVIQHLEGGPKPYGLRHKKYDIKG